MTFESNLLDFLNEEIIKDMRKGPMAKIMAESSNRYVKDILISDI